MFDLDRKALRPGRPVAAAPAGRLVTVLLTSVAYFMVTLDSLVVVTALPSIHRQLGGGVATLQWTVSAYTMAFGAGIITAAALGDRLGRRRVYTAGLLIFTLRDSAGTGSSGSTSPSASSRPLARDCDWQKAADPPHRSTFRRSSWSARVWAC